MWSRYDNAASVAACQKYFDRPTRKNFTAAYNSVLPVIGIVLKKEFRDLSDLDQNDFVQIAAIQYWKLLSNKKKIPRPFGPHEHTNLYYKVAFRAMLKARKVVAPEVTDFRKFAMLPPVASCNFRNPAQRVFVRQIPKIIYDSVIRAMEAKGRVQGKELEVCRYIAQCLVNEVPVLKYQIKQMGGRSLNIKFLVDYVETLVRQAFYEFRTTTKNIDSMLGDEGASLDPRLYFAEFSADAG